MASKQKEKIIRFYRGTEEEETAVKLVDLATQALQSQKFRVSAFLSPLGQEIAETVKANFPGIKIDFFGGYHGAERQKALFVDASFESQPAYGIVVVEASWNEKFAHLSHRDVLGSLMGLGIERDCIGDILVTSECAKIIVDKGMADFLLANLTHIGSEAVKCSLGDLAALAPKEERCKEIRATVASMRVDSIAAAGFGTSRSRAVEDIAADKLKINWQAVKSPSQMVKEGDTLSMRGRGRLEVAEVRGQTKKGRTCVFLKRYL